MKKIALFLLLIDICLGVTFESYLRSIAKSTGTKSIPKEFNKIKKIVDSKINPITNEKIALAKNYFMVKISQKIEILVVLIVATFIMEEIMTNQLLQG